MSDEATDSAARPLPDPSLRPGGGPIVCGYDGSERGRDGLALARLLAETLDGTVEVLSVFTAAPTEVTWTEYERMLEAGEEQLAAEARDALRDLRVVNVTTIPAPSPARELHDLAERCGASVIAVGSTHRGPLGRLLPGTVADRLLAGGPCPIAVAPAGYAEGRSSLGRITVAFDGSAEARAALATAVELARITEAPVGLVMVANPHEVVTAVPMPGGWGGMATTRESVESEERRLRTLLEETLAAIGDRVPAAGEVITDFEPESVIAEASKHCDLLLIGSRGYGPIGRVLLGSVSSGVIRDAACPVIVTPRSAP